MKKNYLNMMLMAFAMIFAVGMFAACSSSDDDNQKTDNPEQKDPVPTSGTLYIYEVLDPDAAKWTDCGFTWLKSGAECSKKFSADGTTVDKLTNAKLVEVIKKAIKKQQSLYNKMDMPLLADNSPVLVDSVSLTGSVVSKSKHSFAMKSGYDTKGEQLGLAYAIGYCFINNFGDVQYLEPVSQSIGFTDQPSVIIKALSGDDEVATSVKITKNSAGFSLSN